jgi:phage terminase large subunit-like protein
MPKRLKWRGTPPWELDGIEVRPEYAAGFWSYALGRPAIEHPKYGAACDMAERDGWNPWWIRAWVDVEAALDGCKVDESRGKRVCDFFAKGLKFVKGRQFAGKPFRLTDWQRYDFIMRLMSWTIWSDDYQAEVRRFRIGSLWVPKKNGKTTLCAGLALYLLRYDREPGAEIYCAAGDRKQAGIVYDIASGMAKGSPSDRFRESIEPIDSQKTLRDTKTASVMRALSADAGLQEGLDWSGMIFDELHVQKNRKLFDTLKGGGAARMEPLFLSISTAGIHDKTAVGWQQWEYARKVREGTHADIRYFALQYFAEKEEDWTHPDTWKKANPSFGLTVAKGFYAAECRGAQEDAADENRFRRYHLNQWVSQVTRWMPMHKWHDCAFPVDREALAVRECFLGFDLSEKIDLSADVLVFPPLEHNSKGRFEILPFFWLPEKIVADAEAKGNHMFRVWARQGHLFITPGEVIDYDMIYDHMLGLKKEFNIVEVPYDGRSATHLATKLMDAQFKLIEMKQGFGLSEALKEWQKMILEKRLAHGDHPVLSYCMDNVMIEKAATNEIRANKDKSTGKIDGVIAGAMALMRAIMWLESGRSVYDERGVLSV